MTSKMSAETFVGGDHENKNDHLSCGMQFAGLKKRWIRGVKDCKTWNKKTIARHLQSIALDKNCLRVTWVIERYLRAEISGQLIVVLLLLGTGGNFRI